MRSPANVLSEIELLVGRYNVKQIDILDDNFTLNIVRAEKIFDEIIKRNIHVLFNFQNGIRADRINQKLVHKMKQAGVYKAGIGIESGDPMIQKIIKKSLDLKTVVKAAKMLRKEGIIVVGFFMIGIPGENPQTVQNTIDFAIKVNPHIANFSMVVPLPQTELFDMIKHGGKFINDVTMGSKTGFYTDDSNFEYEGVNPAFIHKYASKAYKDFYLRPSKIIDMLLSIQSFGELRWVVDTAKPLVRFLCT
jgi:anaerobic magnesium-protoporphyrin IX monomethyl ester cyclase